MEENLEKHLAGAESGPMVEQTQPAAELHPSADWAKDASGWDEKRTFR